MIIKAYMVGKGKGKEWGDDVTILEEVYILEFLENGKKALISRKGNPFVAPTFEYTQIPYEALPQGNTVNVEVVDVSELSIVDERIEPKGVFLTGNEKARAF